MALTKGGYNVGSTFFWNGESHTIVEIDDNYHYNHIGIRCVVVLADNGRTYWLRAD